MIVEHRMDGVVCVVSMKGNLALDEANEAKSALLALINNEDVKSIVINMADVKYLDSKGLGVLVLAYKNMGAKRKKFAICEVTERNSEIFNKTSLNKLIQIVETERDAIATITSAE